MTSTLDNRICFPWRLILLLGTILASVDMTPKLAKADELQVMTYNIRYLNNRDGEDVWANRRDKVVEVIQQADVVGLQEVVAEQLAFIREHTPEFEWYGVGRDDGENKGEMTPIGFRKSKLRKLESDSFWLSESPSEVGKAGWDAALPRIASWMRFELLDSQQKFLFVNTHYDHMGKVARHESSKLLHKWITSQVDNANPGIPTILLGDLNAKLTDAPLRELLDGPSAIKDTRTFAGIMDSGPNSTWNGFKELALGNRIDHVLYVGPIEVLNYETLNPKTANDRFASDHLPILVKIRLRPNQD